MSDREMLGLAAKAAGIDAHWGDGWQSDMMFRALPRPNSPLVTNVEWNPLTDDGDALRLMVKLRLGTLFPTEIGRDRVNVKGHTESLALNDPLAATRRAIVRAAAEIGRQMP
jgi:hypothetical protein